MNDEREQILLEKLHKGNVAAYEEIFETYYSRLCAYAFKLVKQSHIAEEIVQGIFITLWEKRITLKINSLKSYLFRATHNNSLKHLERNKKHVDIDGVSHNVRDDMVYLQYNNFDLGERIEKHINELPERCKEIFILSRFDNLKHAEIAEKLDIAVKTVEVQVRKANLYLREKLKDFIDVIILIILIRDFFTF